MSRENSRAVRRYRARHLERVRAQKALNRAKPENRAKARANARAWYYANLERAKETRGAYYKANKEKMLAKSREWRLANLDKEKARARRRAERRRTDKEYAKAERAKKRLWAGLPIPPRREPDFCECCGRPPSGKKAITLDHDHVTGKFRGWLCDACNRAEGLLRGISGVKKLLSYLERSK